jgi:hypothetical protein
VSWVWLDCNWKVSHICPYMSIAHCYERWCWSSCLCVVQFLIYSVDRQTSFIHYSLTRQCPGNHLVDSSVWLLIVSMLATVDVSKAVDDLGNTVEPTVNYNNAVFRYVISWHKYFCSYRLTTCFIIIISGCLINLNAIFDRARRKLFLLLANLSSLHEFLLPLGGHSATTTSRRIIHLNHDMGFCALPLLSPLVTFLFCVCLFYFLFILSVSATLPSTPILINTLSGPRLFLVIFSFSPCVFSPYIQIKT